MAQIDARAGSGPPRERVLLPLPARWRTPARLNALANYGNFLALAFLNLLLTPVLITALGAASFGIWKACLRFLDLTSFADGRGTQALKWVSAYRSGTVDAEAQRRLSGAAIAVWLLWAPLLLAVLAGIVLAMPWMIEGLTPAQIATARTVAAILALNMLLSGLLGLPDAVLIGANRGYDSLNLNTLFLFVSNIGFVIAARHGYGIVTLAVITLAAAIGNALLTWLAARRNVAWWGIRRPERADIAALGQLSGWTLAWMLAQALLLSGELILFSWLIGAHAVAAYSVTSYATQSGLAICMLTVSAKLPGLARALGDHRVDEAAAGVLRCRELVIAAATVIGGVTLLLNRAFVSVWAGERLYLGDTVNALVVLTFFQLAVLRCDAQLQDATLAIKRRGIAGVTLAAASLAGGWIAYRLTGRIEAAYGALILIRAALGLILAQALSQRIAGVGMPWRLLLASAIVLALAWQIGQRISLPGWPSLILAGGVATGLIALLVIPALTPGTRRSLIGRAL